MNDRDLEKEKFTVVLVANAERRAFIADAVAHSNPLSKEQADIFIVDDLSFVETMSLQELCVIIIDIKKTDITFSRLNEISDGIEHIISKKMESSILTIAIGSELTVNDQRQIYTICNMGLVLSDLDISGTMLASFGLARTWRSIWNYRHSLVNFGKKAGDTIGQWRLLPRSRSVMKPDGSTVLLTQTEWDYVVYIYQRDVKKVTSSEDVQRKFNSMPNQKALVYKIKKKLGAKFPINPNGAGTYSLNLEQV